MSGLGDVKCESLERKKLEASITNSKLFQGGCFDSDMVTDSLRKYPRYPLRLYLAKLKRKGELHLLLDRCAGQRGRGTCCPPFFLCFENRVNGEWQKGRRRAFGYVIEREGRGIKWRIEAAQHGRNGKSSKMTSLLSHGTDIAYLLLYVDIVLSTSSQVFLQWVIVSLHVELSMTNLGPLKYFLGIYVTRNTFGMFLSQTQYATEMFERAHMLICNSCQTLVDIYSKLAADADHVSDLVFYRSLAGVLQYITFTRPYISYGYEAALSFYARSSRATLICSQEGFTLHLGYD
ncbi:ribonuclease H-like domain-containing protein [Tanacetum coccineum]